ncbi:malonyl-CoA decarboxylase [Roseobacteraceae bacterium S113]
MNLLADLLSTLSNRRYRKRAFEGMDASPIEDIANEIVTLSGEAAGLARADALLDRFDRSTDAEKSAFFWFLATQMNIDPARVRSALHTYETAPSRETYSTFAKAVEPARQELIRRLNQVPEATGALVRMRADLLRLGRGVPELEALDLDFRHLFASWFNRGFLVLRAVNWQSPAHLLEKIIAYEAVHTIDSWDDLRRRVQPSDRRCFAFFHPAMPDEPLIFVEIALTQGIPTSIQGLLDEGRMAHPAEDADAAVFYSISNCQPGLAGISFGNSLIKQVASDLATDLPNLDTFVTLSPMPGFQKWLSKHDGGQADQTPEELPALAAYYLLHAKDTKQRPLDPVARFHLGNGAEVHAVHANADLSENGLSQSGGVMVNYLYKFPRLAQNQERFEQTAEVVASNDVRQRAETAILPDVQSG